MRASQLIAHQIEEVMKIKTLTLMTLIGVQDLMGLSDCLKIIVFNSLVLFVVQVKVLFPKEKHLDL